MDEATSPAGAARCQFQANRIRSEVFRFLRLMAVLDSLPHPLRQLRRTAAICRKITDNALVNSFDLFGQCLGIETFEDE